MSLGADRPYHNKNRELQQKQKCESNRFLLTLGHRPIGPGKPDRHAPKAAMDSASKL